MSTLTAFVTVGFTTVAVVTPLDVLKDGSPPHPNVGLVRAQPLFARYGLFVFM
jgi:hypothetical protein